MMTSSLLMTSSDHRSLPRGVQLAGVLPPRATLLRAGRRSLKATQTGLRISRDFFWGEGVRASGGRGGDMPATGVEK